MRELISCITNPFFILINADDMFIYNINMTVTCLAIFGSELVVVNFVFSK